MNGPSDEPTCNSAAEGLEVSPPDTVGLESPAQPLFVDQLEVRDFRNLQSLSIAPSRRFNVVSGDNGQGKTSLLEAIYCAFTSRSFRTQRYKEMRREGSEFSRVEAAVLDSGRRRRQKLTLSGSGRAVFLDGERPKRLFEYATKTPVVVFHPGDLTLTMGSAAARRDLVDRVALFVDPSLSDDRRRYREALRQRQRVLELRGTSAPELPAYEQLAATHGARLTRARAAAVQRLRQDALPALRRLVASSFKFEMHYRPAGDADPTRMLDELEERRSGDRRRRMAGFGPHRDDLDLLLDGRPARKHASQGQHRILSFTMKLSELSAIRRARGAQPIFLLDDVSSELDATRIGAVYAFLRAGDGQVFVTTTRPELFQTPGVGGDERHDYRLQAGSLA